MSSVKEVHKGWGNVIEPMFKIIKIDDENKNGFTLYQF